MKTIERIEAIERELALLKKDLQPEIEVGSWWEWKRCKDRVQVIRVEGGEVCYKYERPEKGNRTIKYFLERFTPCDPPKTETWYLCTEDLFYGCFTRGKEYKATCIYDNSIEFKNNFGKQHIVDGKYLQYFTSPIER